MRLAADSPEYVAFVDVHGHLRRDASPDRRLEREAKLLRDLGRWIGEAVFGPAICSALLFYAPCTVHITIPEEARKLAAYCCWSGWTARTIWCPTMI